MRKTLSLLLVLLAAEFAAAQDPLRWKFDEGRVLRYEVSQEITSQMQLGPNKLSSTTRRNFDVQWKVTKILESGEASLEQRITRIRMATTTDVPASNIEYDTQAMDAEVSPTSERLREASAAWIDKLVEIQATPRGVAKLVTDPKQLPTSALSATSARRMLEGVLLEFPDAAAEPGANWEAKRVLDLPDLGRAAIDTRYTIGERQGDEVLIEAAFRTSIEPIAELKVDVLGQSGEGKIRFDAASGTLQRSELVQVLEMDIEVQGETVRQSMRQVTVVKRVDDEG